MKKIILCIAFILSIFVWHSCEYEWVKPKPGPVNYEQEIQPIWDAHCISCHNTDSIMPDLTAGNSYESLFAEDLIDTITPENSTLYKKMAPGGSMNSYTDPGNADLVLRWIQEGAVGEIPPVSYSAELQPIWNAKCTGCHKSGGIKPDLTAGNSYNSLFAENLIDIATPENSILYKKIAPGGSMNTYVNAGDPELVLKWIQEGAQNN